ncbi:MAG: class I SAM-dependent methyltransferase [Deltaproteobacteria bacterium]|nr:class I SAM-dependent methyltransferase [Deltaproteobacteria bacterium]MBF0524824.1 class I SAM-dependent methyltransferase [Deltaproteobacteria bacterium]
MGQREFFDRMAETWDRVCQHDPGKIIEILDMVDLRPGDAILDVGTGTGILIPFLLPRIGPNGTITAIDLSENMIAVARQKCRSDAVEFMVGDVLTMPLPPASFDAVICYSVFPHFDDKARAIARLDSYLKPGGELIVCHSQSRDAINQLHKSADAEVASDNLPDASEIVRYFVLTGIGPKSIIDDERMFVVVGKKPEV